MPTIAAFPETKTAIRPFFYGAHETPVGHVRRQATPTNTPELARVRLHQQPTGNTVAEMFSDRATGVYQFKNIPAGIYYVVSFDHTGLNNGETVTDIAAVPMTP